MGDQTHPDEYRPKDTADCDDHACGQHSDDAYAVSEGHLQAHDDRDWQDSAQEVGDAAHDACSHGYDTFI